jgi:hypothetical protein
VLRSVIVCMVGRLVCLVLGGLVASGLIAALPEAVLGLVGLLSPTENPGRAIRLVAYRYNSL